MDIEENNEDEEISLDFSKIKNLFKKKKKVSEETIKETEKKIEPEIMPKQEKPKEEANVEKKKETDEKEDDEEINIDFSKIKDIFKRKEKPKVEEAVKTEKEDEEITIDFEKIKGFFKRLKEKKPTEGKEEEISIDAKKTIDFLKKYSKFLLPTLLIIIAMFFSVYLRTYPAYLPATDDWARSAAYNQIRSSIKAQIDQQYPNLPEANKNSLVDQEFEKILKEQKTQINQQIKATSNYFKSILQNDKGQTYLLAIDPYFWMRHAKNILENGHPGDELRDGVPYDNHMFAPLGRPVPQDMFHAYFEAYLYKFLRFFNRDLDLMTLVFYVPVILSALAVIPAFFIGKRLSGNFGGFVAALIIAIHPAFMSRTAGGFSDTDAYSVLFPLLVTWVFLEAFETKSIRKMVIYSTISGFFVGLFSFAWGGWFYIFDFIVIASIFYILYFIILHIKEIKNTYFFIKKPNFRNTLILIFIFIVSSALFTSLFTSFGVFRNAFISGPTAFAKLKQVGITSIWPNVYTTVAEQNPSSLNSVISQIGVGSVLLFLIGLTGIALTMLRKETKKASDLWFALGSIIWFIIILAIRPQNLTWFLVLISLPIIIKLFLIIKNNEKEVDIKAAILLILWFIATIYASVKGIRFTLLVVPAFALGFGISLGIGYYYLHKLITKSLKINKTLSKILAVIVLLLIAGILPVPFPPFCVGKTCSSAISIAKGEVPSMNDAWYSSLEKINFEAEPNAIINSWWDFGHWFKMIGDRAVTFDGTSQTSPNAHWIGSVLLTNDEDYAVGTLRMVDCGQNKAFNELDKVIKNEVRSIKIIYKIVRLDKESAKSALLNEGLDEEEANRVLEFTHCIPPEDYFITSYDMISKAGVWAHFGSWNFDRALIYNTLKKKEYQNNFEKSISFLQERFNYTREKAESVYYDVQSIRSDSEANSWIAPWPSYAGESGCSKPVDDKIKCGIGQGAQAEINIETLQADIQTAQGIMHPNSVVFPLEDGSYKEKYFNNTVGLSINLIPTGEESYKALISSPELAKSMFTIMFYLNGHGLKHFEKFSDVTDITGGRIIVWKVNWEGTSDNLLGYYQTKPAPEEELQEEIIEEEPLINNSQDINTTNNSSN